MNPYIFFAIFATSICCDAKKMLRDIGNTTRAEVERELDFEFAGHIPEEKIEELEDALKPMFTTLPKNAKGRVGHQAVRYALHRHFVSRRGWYIKGLEPTSKATSISTADWVPSFVQDRLEEHLGNRGMNLHELASIAAVLDDLIRQEAGKRLKVIYDVLLLPTNEPIAYQQALDAINTYTMVHLLGGKKNISISNPKEVAKKRAIFTAKYRNFSEFDEWFKHIEAHHLGKSTEAQVEFSSMLRLVEEFGERYGTFNDVECRALKASLTAHEGMGRGVGRVSLATFYNMSRYSHWKLHEKREYLRDLGALDESNESAPLVIVPNYIASRPNCLEATPLYSVCCRDECEDLIGTLEREFATPKVHPDKIVEVVSRMPSDTVIAPRTLSSTLVKRLEDIATLHYGEVDMHSRLFAQWMHHAFPRECPYPHEAGTTNPVSADEWMKTNGHDSQLASEEDIQQILDGACGQTGDEGEDGELPWSHAEELLEPHAPPEEVADALYGLVVLTMTLWALLALYLGRFRKTVGVNLARKAATLVAITIFIVLAVSADLVDKEVVGFIIVVGLILDMIRYAYHQMIPTQLTPKVL